MLRRPVTTSDRRPPVSACDVSDNIIVLAVYYYTIKAGKNMLQRSFFKALHMCVFYIHAVLILWLCVGQQHCTDKLSEHSVRPQGLSEVLTACESLQTGPCVR